MDEEPLATAEAVKITRGSDGGYALSGTLTMPPAGFTGIDSFDYTLDDGLGGTDIGTVFITVS